MTSLVGTSFYIAPEVVEGEYTKAADLWYYPPTDHIILGPFLTDFSARHYHDPTRAVC